MHDQNYSNDLMSQAGRGSSAMIGGFVLGAAIGAGIALLFAPCNGEETRRRISGMASKLRDEAGTRMTDVRSRIGELREDAQSALDTGREAFAKSREDRGSNRVSAYTPPNPSTTQV